MQARWLVPGLLVVASSLSGAVYDPPVKPSADLLEYLGTFEPAAGQSFDVSELIELFGASGKTTQGKAKETKTVTKKKEGGYE